MAASDPLARFDVKEQSGIRTVHVWGEIDVSNVAELDAATTKLSNEALGVVVDLDRTDYIDSATVRVLFELRRRLARRGQLLRVVSNRGSSVHRVLNLTGFLDEDAEPDNVDAAVDEICRKLEPN